MTENRVNILIVDDSAITRAMIRRTLILCGLNLGQIFDASDGKAALAVLATQHVDMVLADLHMPVMGGAELAGRIILNPLTRHIPLIAVTAEPSLARLQELQRTGIRAIVRKPFTPEAIRDAVTDVLASIDATSSAKGVAHA